MTLTLFVLRTWNSGLYFQVTARKKTENGVNLRQYCRAAVCVASLNLFFTDKRTAEDKRKAKKYIILFDGSCRLCNNVVRFITKNDSRRIFCFIALESEKGEAYLKLYKTKNVNKGSVLLIRDEKIYTKSNAVLNILKCLDGVWPLFYVFIIVPAFIRDPVYDIIARYRYRWFGAVNGSTDYRSCQE